MSITTEVYSCGHRGAKKRRRPKRQADEFAAGYLGPEMHGKAEAEPEPLTLETLFDIYGEEVTPTKRGRSRLHDRAATRMFLGCFGRDRKPATLSQRDWDRFIRERRAGRVGPSGKPVADRMIERDLKFLIAVLNWAVKPGSVFVSPDGTTAWQHPLRYVYHVVCAKVVSRLPVGFRTETHGPRTADGRLQRTTGRSFHAHPKHQRDSRRTAQPIAAPIRGQAGLPVADRPLPELRWRQPRAPKERRHAFLELLR